MCICWLLRFNTLIPCKSTINSISDRWELTGINHYASSGNKAHEALIPVDNWICSPARTCRTTRGTCSFIRREGFAKERHLTPYLCAWRNVMRPCEHGCSTIDGRINSLGTVTGAGISAVGVLWYAIAETTRHAKSRPQKPLTTLACRQWLCLLDGNIALFSGAQVHAECTAK